MSETLVIALVVSILSPAVLSALTSWQSRALRQQDWVRQDQVAARAEKAALDLLHAQQQASAEANLRAATLAARTEEARAQAAKAAQLLYEAQQESILRTDEVARLAAEHAARADSKLDQIHTLVNSQMTAAMEGELDQTERTLVLLERLLDLSTKAGHRATDIDLTAVRATKARIVHLKRALDERAKAQAIVDSGQQGVVVAVDVQYPTRPPKTPQTSDEAPAEG